MELNKSAVRMRRGHGAGRAATSSRCCRTTRSNRFRHLGGRALYSSTKGTDFTVIELNSSKPVEDYLNETERIVQATFPDESRRRQVEDGVWEITLLQQDFFGVKFSPSTKLRVQNREGELTIQVTDLDLSDLPQEIRVPAEIKVEGRMTPRKKKATSKIVHLSGKCQISLDVDVPFPYSTFPMLRETVEALLGSVIGRLEESLKRSLPQDYAKWTKT